MADLDFAGVQESHPQVRSRAQHCCPSMTLSRMGGTARLPEAPLKGESKSNGEVERAVQAVHGLARTLKDFLEQQCGITVESRSPLLAWLVEHCSDLLLLFYKCEPHDGHTAYMPLKGKPWRIELPSFGECVDRRKGTRHKLESRWSRGVCLWGRFWNDEPQQFKWIWSTQTRSIFRSRLGTDT